VYCSVAKMYGWIAKRCPEGKLIGADMPVMSGVPGRTGIFCCSVPPG